MSKEGFRFVLERIMRLDGRASRQFCRQELNTNQGQARAGFYTGSQLTGPSVLGTPRPPSGSEIH
jgi:hypothetical protein